MTALPNPPNNPSPSVDVTTETILLAILKQRWSVQISYATIPQEGSSIHLPQFTVRAVGPEGFNYRFPMHNAEAMSIAPTLQEAVAVIPQKMADERKRLRQ